MKFEEVMVGLREGRITKASYQQDSDTLIELKIERASHFQLDMDRELRRYVNGEHVTTTGNFRKGDLEADWKIEHDIVTQQFNHVVLDVKLLSSAEVLMYRGTTIPDALRAVLQKFPKLSVDDVRSICAYHEQGIKVLFDAEIMKVYGEAKRSEV